jgi:hypothetical protein
LRLLLELDRQEVLANRVELSNVVGSLSLVILDANVGLVLLHENLDDVEGRRLLARAGGVEARVPRAVPEIQARARLAQQRPDEVQHGGLARHVERDLPLGRVDDDARAGELGHQPERPRLVVALAAVREPPHGVLGGRRQRVRDLLKLLRGPGEHGCRRELVAQRLNCKHRPDEFLVERCSAVGHGHRNERG